MASCFDHVPVVEVCTDNFTEVWPFMVQAIKKSSFVAVDTELSGIGDRKQIMAQSVEDRYKYMCEVAQSRSILSLGISCFRQKKTKRTNNNNSDQSQRTVDGNCKLKVQTFNIIVLCTENFVVEPASLKFLVEHGFDFNKQYAKGVSYTRGIDRVQSKQGDYTVRRLFTHLVLANKPLVLHNGLFDLIFLYQNFYCKLPDNLQVFTADLLEMFPAGIFDTKYVSEFYIREPASYLIYLFRKSQRNNILHHKLGEKHVAIKFPEEKLLLEWTEELYCKVHSDFGTAQRDVAVCEKYAAYGFCPQQNRCPLSHDVDDVLDRERKVKEHKRKKRKRKFQSSSGNSEPVMSESSTDNNTTSEEKPPERSARDVHASQDDAHATPPDKVKTRDCGHRAGFDAFMTGYCMATYLLQLSNQRDSREFSLSSLVDISNKVSLTKKEVPLQVTRSHFIRPSALHSEKLKEIKASLTSCSSV